MSTLTKAQKKALLWIKAHQPVGSFPIDGPRLAMVCRLEDMALVERAGKEPGSFGFEMYKVSAQGQAALEGKRS